MSKLWMIALSALSLCAACGSEPVDPQSQTHWLKLCGDDSDCGGLSCVCGACVALCNFEGSCSVPGLHTECQRQDSSALLAMCGAEAPEPLCLEPCTHGCAVGSQCVGGACIHVPAESAHDAGSSATHETSGSGGALALDAGTAAGTGGHDPGSAGSGSGSAGTTAALDAGTEAGGAGTSDGAHDAGAAGSAGATGALDAGSAACISGNDACDLAPSDNCCAGTHCVQVACTDSIPPHCFGSCQPINNGK